MPGMLEAEPTLARRYGHAFRVAGAALILFLACGGETSDSRRGTEPGLEPACERLAAAACERREPCEALGGSGQRFLDVGQCRERWALSCALWTTAPGSRLAVEDIVACSQELDAAPCNRIAPVARPRSSRLPWCLRVPGERPEGAACTVDAQCATSHCGQEQGVWNCVPLLPELAHEGEPCAPPVTNCATLHYCEEGRCQRAPCPSDRCYDEQASCGGIDDPESLCPLGTECGGRSDRGSGQCVPYAVEGEPCRTYDGPSCLFPARCEDGICAL